jgi:proline dehydrogenase
MLRSFFTYWAGQRWLKNAILKYEFTRRASRRFVAGETIAEALAVIQELHQHNIRATLDHLGENVATEADARQAAAEYGALLGQIQSNGLPAHVSLKLTQFGLDMDDDLCRALVAEIVEQAAGMGSFVRIDMESSAYTERTLAVYRALRKKYTNVGIVLQACLYRTVDDVKRLVDEGIANVRLCKGAYLEPPERAFRRKADVDANMVKLAQYLLSNSYAYLAMATHDEKIIHATQQSAARYRQPGDCFEFQMLYGIRRDLQRKLVKDGYRMRVYVPYGTEWYPYFMRRLAERPANVGFILRNLFN